MLRASSSAGSLHAMITGAPPAGALSSKHRSRLGSAGRARSLSRSSSQGDLRVVAAAGTGTGTNTNAETQTEATTTTRASSRPRLMIFESKNGETRYGFGKPPVPKDAKPGEYYDFAETGAFAIGDASASAGRQGQHQHLRAAAPEEKIYAVLNARGGVQTTGLVLAKGEDGHLVVADILPGGSAVGVLRAGDVLSACAVVVGVEDKRGDFIEEYRWHDATKTDAMNTVALLMTLDGELRLRAVRNYVSRRDKGIRESWASLVPTATSKDVRKTWSRLLPKPPARGTTGRNRARPPVEEGVKGIWSSLLGDRMRPVVANVAEDIPKAWSGLYPGGTNMVGFDDSPNASSAALDELLDETDDAGADAAAAETETHQEVVVEVEEEEEVLDDDALAAREKEIADALEIFKKSEAKQKEEAEADDENAAAAAAAAAAELDYDDDDDEKEEEEEEEPKTFTEHEVVLDCSSGVNMTGLAFDQRSDGLTRVKVVRAGGTAAKKVKVGDVLLATTRVVMVADPTGERARGVPKLEWIDATDGTSFNDLQAAMMTHSQEMRLKLARGDVPPGYMSFGAQTAKAFEDADAEATIAEEKQQSARQQSGESASGGGGGSADDGIPEDIKEWAARIAAEAREGRTA